MPFGGFDSLQDVMKKYQVRAEGTEFVCPLPMPVNAQLRERLKYFKVNAPLNSEQAICEFIIAPILQEMWLMYADSLMLWSHVPFGTDAPLKGVPDYFLARRSPLGRVMDQPYVLFVEAKRDNFDDAWAQCLAAMLAAQQLNTSKEQTIHGGVSSGESWYFGKLTGKVLVQDPRAFTVTELDHLFAALHFVIEQAKLEAQAP